MKRVNDWLAVKITETVGTMWCAYIFVGLAILGFPYGSDKLPDYVQWVSQTFIQLVMLSVIMVGQNLITNKQNEHDEKLDTHAEKLDAVHSHLGIGDKDNK